MNLFDLFRKADVLLSYGYAHKRRRIHLDARGQPFVWIFGEAVFLLPNGHTWLGMRDWWPLSARALAFWEGPAQ